MNAENADFLSASSAFICVQKIFYDVRQEKGLNMNLPQKTYQFHSEKIFTTGAFLQPMQVLDESGNEKWFWVVNEFIDDSFQDGEIYNPKEFGKSKKELIENTTN